MSDLRGGGGDDARSVSELLADAESSPVLADSAGFLLSKVGAHVSRAYRERLAPLDLEPPHAALLTYIASAEGLSQRALGDVLEVAPSRMVALVDELERRGLVQRQRDPADRRAYALYLTDRGHELRRRTRTLQTEFERELSAPLDDAERRTLIALLRRLAAEQGIPLGVHPNLTTHADGTGC